MYNTDLPRRVDLPTTARLLRSTVVAAVSATAILVTVVLPAEYAIDPTGLGRTLGLTQMGEIKTQLAEEAAADAAGTAAPTPETPRQALVPAPSAPPVPAPAPTAVPAPVPAAAAPAAPEGKSDEITFTLTPGQGAEIKLVMNQGARAHYEWWADGPVNFDTHGDGGGRSISYEQGRSVTVDEGQIEAAFDGNHGWFWRNRTKNDVTITLKTSGDYAEFKRAL